MSLKKYPGSDLNQISATLQKYLDDRKLVKGGIAKYRLLNGIINTDPTRLKGNDIIFPSSTSIALRANILDPGDEGANNERNVEIGSIISFDDKTKLPLFKSLLIHPTKGDGGLFFIRHGVIAEMDMYESIELLHSNGSNPFRDTSSEPLFERVNDIEESTAKSKRRDYIYDSLTAIRSWDYSKMRLVGAGFNFNTKLPMEVLKDMLEELAMKDAKTFYESIDSRDLELKSLVRIAVEAEVISFIAHESKWVMNGSNEVLVLLDRKEGVTEFEQLAQFIKNSANGDKVKGNLEKLIKAKMAIAKK